MAGKQLILASASPRRKSLMKEGGFKCRVVASRIKETHPRRWRPSRLVRQLALEKAVSVSRKNPHAVVLGADTVVYINRRVIGKPKNVRHARRILNELSGQWQSVYTGVAVVWAGGKNRRAGVALSRVKMHALSRRDIDRVSHRHLDKAGAYAIQEKGDRLVEKVIGDFDNVVGLPMKLVRRLLRGLV